MNNYNYVLCGGIKMTEYLKMLLVAIITGFTAPMPSSSAAHFNLFSNVLGLSGGNVRYSFYYNAFLFVFSIVIFFSFRNTVLRGFKLAFKTKKESDNTRDNMYFVKNIIFSLIPTIILFIPISKEKLLMDYIDTFLNQSGLLLSSVACVVTALVLIIAIWYTKKSENPVRRAVDKKNVLRMSFYQIPCYVIPGFSHIASGAVNFFISDIGSKSLMGQLYIYLAPSMFFVSLIKMIRAISNGILFDPIALIVGLIVFAIAARFAISLTTKIDIRRLLTFFSIYSVIFGIFVTAITFSI